MTALKNLMQRRASYRCPGRPPHLQHFRHVPGPKRPLRTKARYFEPRPQKRGREQSAAVLAKLRKEIEAVRVRSNDTSRPVTVLFVNDLTNSTQTACIPGTVLYTVSAKNW